MKYFKHYSEWAVSHSVFSKLGKLFKKVGKVERGEGGAAPTIKKATIQNVDYFEMKAKPYRN